MAGLVLVHDLARVEQHDAVPDAEKVVLDLEIVHRDAVGDDRLEQVAQRRYVPLAVAEREQQAAVRVGRLHLEGLVEGAARREHVEVLIEDEERLRNRVDDRQRENLGVFQLAKRVDHTMPPHAGGSAIVSRPPMPARRAGDRFL